MPTADSSPPLPGPVLGADGHVIFDQATSTTSPTTPTPGHGQPEPVAAVAGDHDGAACSRSSTGCTRSATTTSANLTVVEGDDGLVIIDCMSGVETAQQGMALFREHVSDKPVAAVIYTHTHIDHYGGVKGIVDAADVASGKVPIIAPGTIASFDKFAIGENVVAGNAMSRRAQLRVRQPAGPRPKGFVSCGIGIAPQRPDMSYISPTDGITETGTKRDITGLNFEFLYAPGGGTRDEAHRDTDIYEYIHDQALRLANKGYTPLEAAEVIELPADWAVSGSTVVSRHRAPRRSSRLHQGVGNVGRRPGVAASTSPVDSANGTST